MGRDVDDARSRMQRAAWGGLGLWLVLLPVLVWQLPCALQRLLSLWERRPAQVVVLGAAPAKLEVVLRTHTDDVRQVAVAVGRDAAGCVRYAGQSELPVRSAGPLVIYLLRLPAWGMDCP